MVISEETKKAIIEEYETFVEGQYAGKTKKERQALGQFFTPPALTIKMIEKFTDLSGSILDPTGGSGNLLVACIIAGADPKECYYNELDPQIFELGKSRLKAFGVPEKNMHIGNALDASAFEF